MVSEPENSTAMMIKKLLAGPQAANRLFSLPGISYGELYTLAARLQNALTPPPTREPAAPVCICTADRTLTAAALLASLADGPPLVMPYAHSRPVLAELHRLTAFKQAIVDGDYPLPAGVQQINISDLPCTSDRALARQPLDPEAPWVHLFTGGSTGSPRLWTKTVRNLLSEAAYLKTAFSVSAGDRVLTTSPPYHIFGLLYSLLVPLLAGAGVMTATPAFPGELAAALKKDRPTILVTVPAYYRALRNHFPLENNLRVALSSASPLSAADADAFFGATGAPIHDLYGSTETGGIASKCRAKGELDYTPFTCIDLRIVNARLQVRSNFLSPQLSLNAEGYFEAADRITDCGGGRFTLIGRSDGIIKVGGKRVDLEEIRALVMAIDGIRDALVFARPTETGRGNEILALVETDGGPTAISRKLCNDLEPYARPRAIRTTPRMPVTTTGKYDRQAIGRFFSK